MSNKQTAVNTLRQELNRLSAQISQAEKEVERTAYASREGLQERIASNEQRIAEIDSQIAQRILNNYQTLSEITAQQTQIEQTMDEQILVAPISGRVSNLKASQPGYVANPSEPLMEVVPDDILVARIFIPSSDIGFVELNDEVDVRLTSFPYGEFGDIKGTLTSISHSALPPDDLYPYARYAAEVLIDKQQFPVSNDRTADRDLRAGMSLEANIHLRKRPVITFLTDLFTQKFDAVKSRN